MNSDTAFRPTGNFTTTAYTSQGKSLQCLVVTINQIAPTVFFPVFGTRRLEKTRPRTAVVEYHNRKEHRVQGQLRLPILSEMTRLVASAPVSTLFLII